MSVVLVRFNVYKILTRGRATLNNWVINRRYRAPDFLRLNCNFLSYDRFLKQRSQCSNKQSNCN